MNMATLTNIGKFARQIVLCKNSVPRVGVRCVYNKDTNDYWKPGKYPTTEEERRKAAEKYGLHPDEYEPLPITNAFKSDYPNLPAIGDAVKDPHYPWDYPIQRKMANEPLHTDYIMMTVDKVDFGQREYIEPVHCALILTGMVIVFCFLAHLVDPYPSWRAATKKQYPKVGTVHYTFEPAK